MNKKIVFIHSLNNYTGSPNVLSVIINGFVTKGYNVELITSRGDGFLSNMEGVSYGYTNYQWSDYKILTLFWLMLSQIQLFFKILFYPKQNTLYYINTIVPFGAALACYISRKTFVYHVHENMQQKKPIYAIFRWVYSICNCKSIFVSNYLKNTALSCNNGIVAYNSLSPDFLQTTNKFMGTSQTLKEDTILMVASLRKFKGIYEFIELAKCLPKYTFKMILSATNEEVNQFTNEIGYIKNLTVYSSQTNLHPFYRKAKLLLQLSHPESCIETFGLTILEAMVYGVPAIVPNVGGPTELIDHGKNGYTLDPMDIKKVKEKIQCLMEDEILYKQFSMSALHKSKVFSKDKLTNNIEQYIFENKQSL